MGLLDNLQVDDSSHFIFFGVWVGGTLPIEFEVESLQVAVNLHLTDRQPLKNRLTTLEELDERRWM